MVHIRNTLDHDQNTMHTNAKVHGWNVTRLLTESTRLQGGGGGVEGEVSWIWMEKIACCLREN